MPAEENNSPKIIVAGPQPQSMSTLWPVSQRFPFFPTLLHTTWHLQPYTITDFSLDLWESKTMLGARLEVVTDRSFDLRHLNESVQAALTLKSFPSLMIQLSQTSCNVTAKCAQEESNFSFC